MTVIDREQIFGYDVVSVPAIQSVAKGKFIAEVCWTVALFFVQFCVLAFYWRLFSVSKNARHAIYWTSALVASWFVGVVCIYKPIEMVYY